MILKNLIIPVFQWDRNLKIIFLGHYFNLPSLAVRDVKANKLYVYNNVIDNSVTDEIFYFKCFALNNLIYGEYTLYAFNPETKEYSQPININITGVSKKTTLNIAIQYSGYKDNEIIFDFCDSLKDNDNYIFALLKQYRKVKKQEHKLIFAYVLQNYISIINMRIRSFNLTSTEFYKNTDLDVIYSSVEAAQILQINLETLKPRVFQCYQDKFEYDSLSSEDELSLYIEKDVTGLPLNLLLDFKPVKKINDLIKEKRIEYLKEYDKTLEITLSYPEHYFNFSQKEVNYIILLTMLQSSSPLLSAPSIELYDNNIAFYFDKQESKLMKNWPQSLRIAYVEVEMALSKDYVRYIDIIDQELDFCKNDLDIINEDYFYWIEDINGNILSNTGIIPCDTETSIEINEKVDQYWIYKYNEHLMPYAINKFNDISGAMNTITTSLLSNLDCNISNYYHKIINKIVQERNTKLVTSVIRAALEDRMVYNKYKMEFFNEPFILKNYDKTVMAPKIENAIYVFESYSKNEQQQYDVISSNLNKEISYEFKNCQYGIVWAFDSITYTFSGFLVLDYTKSLTKAKVYNFLCEVTYG